MKMETENITVLVSTSENDGWSSDSEDVFVNGLLRDDILSARWDSADEQTDTFGGMDIDTPSAGIHIENGFTMAFDEDPVPEMFTSGMNLEAGENFLFIESPSDILSSDGMDPSSSLETGNETSIPPKRKRGRKPKSERGLFIPRPRKPPKTRIYEIEQPFEDKNQERRRLSAVNAKKHRDQQKNQMKELEQQIEGVKEERDSLKKEEETLRMRVENQLKQVELYKKHLQNLAASSVQILQATP